MVSPIVSLALCVLLAQAPGAARELDFAASVAAGSAEELRAWTAVHPGEVFGKTRSLLVELSNLERGAPRAAELRAQVAFVARALGPSEPAAVLSNTVVAWSDVELTELRRLRGEIDAAREQLDRDDEAGAWTSIERVLAAPDSFATLSLLNRPLSEFARRVSARGHDDRTRRLLEAVDSNAERARDLPWVVWYSGWLGQFAWVDGDLALATRRFEYAIEAGGELGDTSSASSVLSDLALVRLDLGDLDAAARHAARAEDLALALADGDLRRKAVAARVSCLYAFGEIEAALDLLSYSDELGRACDATQFRLDLSRAQLLQDAGRLESARTWAERALALAEDEPVRAEAPNLLGSALLVAGLLYGDLGERERGLATLDRAVEFFTEVGEPAGVAWARKNRGWILLDQGRADLALIEFEAALARARANDEAPLEGISALGCAASADREGARFERGAQQIDAWLDVADGRAREQHDLDLTVRVATLRGSRHAARGDDVAALAQFELAVDACERLRTRYSLPDLLTHFLRDKVDPYRQAVFAAARLGLAERALRFAEMSRARVLFEMRARSDLAGAGATDDARVQAARHALAQAESALRAEHGEGDRETRLRIVRDAERDLDAALLDAALSSPRAARLGGSSTADLDLVRVAQRLRSGAFDTIVEYVLGERESLALVIRARDGEPRLDLVALPVAERDVRALVERMRAPVEALARGELDLVHLGFDFAAARAAYDALVAPLAHLLGPRIAIVPDGVLWNAPFEAFASGGALAPVDPARPFAHLRGVRFWIADETIGYLPSVSVLALDARASEARGLVAVLPGNSSAPESASSEIAALQALPSERLGDVGVCASSESERIEREVASARWLHFVAHGLFDERFPANSHLDLGFEGGAASRLAAWQVESWRSSARLVVLSACHGGEGVLAAGEGALGLTRSFLVAGAEEVIASSWAVEDRATSELMAALWRDIANGAEPLDALRSAKLRLMASDDARGFARAHPYFWAAWVSHRGN